MAESSLAAEPRQIAFDAQNAEHVRWTVAVWNQAANSSIPLTERFLKYSFTEDAGVVRAGRIAFVQDRPAGFVLCSVHPGAPPAMRIEVTGWIEAIAVAPTYQRKGIGRKLLGWAQNWLDSQEYRSASGLVKVGGGPRHFVPGVQAGSDAELFFLACGFDYEDEPFTWDVARSLSDYSPPLLDHVPAAARPGQPGQEGDVLGFLASEFPEGGTGRLRGFWTRADEYRTLCCSGRKRACRDLAGLRLRTLSIRLTATSRTSCRVRGDSLVGSG